MLGSCLRIIRYLRKHTFASARLQRPYTTKVNNLNTDHATFKFHELSCLLLLVGTRLIAVHQILGRYVEYYGVFTHDTCYSAT